MSTYTCLLWTIAQYSLHKAIYTKTYPVSCLEALSLATITSEAQKAVILSGGCVSILCVYAVRLISTCSQLHLGHLTK